MLNKHSETFFGLDCDYGDAKVVLFGAPFDSTTSFRPGTRFASKAMRGDSFGLESYSPYQDKDLYDYNIFDSGDLELCFGNTGAALKDIEGRVATILAGGKLPLMVGGEHLVTLGAVRAAADRFPGLQVVHLDAHTDLREDYLGEPLSHATVIRRVWELTGDDSIHQFGIRSGERHEFQWAAQHTCLHKFDFTGLDQCLEDFRDKPVYLTIDLDVLDPAAFPGTGTPEAGGVSFSALLDALLRICGSLRIVGCDLCELSPAHDPSGASTATALKVLRELLLALVE